MVTPMDPIDPEELITCPYDKVHMIRRKKFAVHLVKCRKNYPNVKHVSCDYNANHMVPELELKYHHDHCPDKKQIETACYVEEGTNLNQYPICQVSVDHDETWEDYFVKSYDPKKHCETADVIRGLDVEPPSMRRDFRFKERKRLAEIEQKKQSVQPSTSQDEKENDDAKKELPRPRNCDKPDNQAEVPEYLNKLMSQIKLEGKAVRVPKF